MTPKAGLGRLDPSSGRAPTGREPVRTRARVGLPVLSEVGSGGGPDGFVEPARPQTRADCLPGGRNAQRPCPYVSCAAHLALEVRSHGTYATLRESFPGVEVWDMVETCVLDVADRGGAALEEVAALMNLTPERARQVEALAMERVEGETGAAVSAGGGRGGPAAEGR